jgi:putative ABC transport system substrate-binding protein
MRRREFIALLSFMAVAMPRTGGAQPSPARVPVIAALLVRPLATRREVADALRQGMLDHGFVDGRSVRLVFRSVDGDLDRLPTVVAALLQEKPDVIVTWGTEAVRAVQSATSTVPVVMASIGDPVGAGVAQSLSRPGGNITGFSLFATETVGKRLELLKELMPNVRKVLFLWNPDNKSVELQFLEARALAQGMGIELLSGPAKRREDIDAAIGTAARAGAEAVLSTADQLFGSERARIVGAATRSGIPVGANVREFATAGAVFSYGSSLVETSRLAAGYVDRILKGANPADLPIQQPTKFELVLNLRAARGLGMEVPPALLARADEVIE